jgi:outer membrane receptor protein involved in Fe transport
VFRELLEEQLGFYTNQANRGRQRTYGVEMALQYRGERVRMMANYAWSRALRTYLTPDTHWQPYGLDQPLRFNLVAATTARRWNFGVRFTAVSGNPARFYPAGTPVDEEHSDPEKAGLMRLPTFWQVDVRVDRAWKTGYGKLSLFLDLLNVTNHRNVEMRYNERDDWNRPPDPMRTPRWAYGDDRGLPIIPTIGLELVPQ